MPTPEIKHVFDLSWWDSLMCPFGLCHHDTSYLAGQGTSEGVTPTAQCICSDHTISGLGRGLLAASTGPVACSEPPESDPSDMKVWVTCRQATETWQGDSRGKREWRRESVHLLWPRAAGIGATLFSSSPQEERPMGSTTELLLTCVAPGL